MSLSVTTNVNHQVKAGQIIFVQGMPCKSINFLMEGEIEILATSEKDLTGMEEREIIDDSRRVCTLEENTFFGVDSVLTGDEYNYSMRATKDSTVSVYPTEKISINALIQNKLNYAFLMARSLMKLQQKSMHKIKTMDVFIRDVQRIQDTLALVYKKLAESYKISSNSHLSAFAQGIWENFKSVNGELPVPLNVTVLKNSYETVLDKKYGFDSNLENQKLNFLYKFFSAPSDHQLGIFQHDGSILKYLAVELAGEIGNIMGEIDRSYKTFKQEFTHFTQDKENWLIEFSTVLDYARKKNNLDDVKLVSDVLKYLINLVTSVDEKFFNTFNFKLSASEKAIALAKSSLEGKVSVQQEEIAEENIPMPEEAKGTLTKLLDYSEVDEATRKEIITNINEFKRVEDKMSDSTEVRKLRKNITALHWKLFEEVYLKSYKSSNRPKYVQMYLYYGLIDETLLKASHVAAIYNFNDKPNSKYPIYYATEWLDKIFGKDVDPSIDELGQSFYEIVREEHKDKLRGRKLEDLPEELNSGEDRVLFELRRMLKSTVKTTNGQLRTAVPVLLAEQIWRDIDSMRVTRQRLEKVIDDIMERDFSAFHRQILYKNSERNIYKEFIIKQVIPNFIIVPSAGINVMMWQSIDGRNKASSGRFVFPAFANDPSNTSQYDDLFLLTLKACGVFRWELLRELLGHAWTDPTESSLTSDYMDYIQFYRKNPKLSPEVKEAVKIEFKRFRTDRDKFVNDYINWIIYEFDGQMKLNVVAREIFFKHVPFKKAYLDKLGKSPRYADIHTRLTNIRKKKLREMQNRYYKYTKDGASLPEELQDNMDFLQI